MTNTNEKLYTVKVRYQRTGENLGAYDKVTVVSPWTGMELTIAGFFDGDMCEDIRNKVAQATTVGLQESTILLSKKDLWRWREAHAEMVRHYCD